MFPRRRRLETGGGEREFGGLYLALTLVVAAAVLSPVLTFGFFGDDFDLWLTGKELQKDGSLLLIGPSNFYRPANALLFAVHDLVFGPYPLGYHVTVLALHLLCGCFMWRILDRHGVSPPVRAVASFAWLTSPYALEPLWATGVAYSDLTVCAVWLGLAAHWPEERWSWGRAAALGGAVLFSVFCKESWVIVPGLMVVLELTTRRTSRLRAAVTGCIAGVPVAAYLVTYGVVFGDRFGGPYTSGGPAAWLKVPHAWAAFFGLSHLAPTDFGFGLGEVMGIVVFAGCAVLALGRSRDRLMTLGLTIFGLPFLPILAAPWLPPRYTTVPFAGAVLVMVALASWLVRTWQRRRTAVAVACVVATLLIARQLLLLRGDLHDIGVLDDAHRRLVTEADEAVPGFPDAELVVCVRLDPSSPMRAMVATAPQGHEKAYFFRAEAPYDLVHWEALVSFAQARAGIDQLWARIDQVSEVGAVRWAVVAHRQGRIVALPSLAEGPAQERDAWRKRGARTRIIVRR